ncbi:unnamed protein product [Acanthoscelides obtectus]|uniref:Uncharacterized protein n=1 Tax=Acanthoscelides obtectus TaxID=200917 RepID=A0A9P0Q1D9_ACAOB|nr:unnamed protein product [Acanthoscelides obtectus]CAK1620541.1 hypothetical protein AOBTE_LOCUS436 [Acanthoscelides obtectus]
MPYYSDIGTSGSAKSLLLSGPYANHSSIIASNYIPYSNTLPRQYRAGYKPQLTTISEFNSPLRRVDSPKLYHSSPKVVSIRPIKIIDTADIDVSVNRYRKFNKYERTKPEILDLKPVEKTPSPKTVQATEEKEAKPTTTIKRERATVRIKTVHEDTFKDEINEIKSWRDNFKEDELFETGGKRVRKSPGEILKEKFLIRSKSKENIAKLEPAPNNRRKSVSKSPSFRDICKAITTDDNIDDLNPGQPLEVQIKQSRQVSTEDIIKHIRRSSTQLSADDLNILDHILQKESEEPEPAHPGAKKKKAVRKKTGEILTSGDTVADSEQETEGRGTVKKKKVLKKGTSDESVVSGECKKTDADFDSRGSFKKKRDSSISKSSSKDTLLIDSSPVCDEIIDKCEEVGDIKQPEKHLDKSKDLKGNIIRLNKAPTKSDLIKDQSELKITTPIKVVSDISPKDKLLELSSKKDTLKQKVISKSDSSTSLPDKKIITSLNKSNSSQSLPEDKALDLFKKKADIAQDLSKKKTLFSKAESTTSLPDAKAKELDKSSSSKSLPDEKTNTSQLTKKSNEFSELSKDLPFLQQKPLVKKSANKEVTDKNKMTESIIAPKMPTVRDISQVDIEQTVFKPKPVITGTIGEIEEKKSPLKVVVDNVEIVESPKKKDKKFRFNLDVEVKAEPPKVKMPIENGTVELPAPKDPLVIGILKKKPLSLVGQVLEEKERTLRIKKVATKKETDSTVVGVEKCAQSDKKADSKVPLSPNDKEEPKGVIKRKLFVTKPSHSSTDSSAPPSPVTLASPFIKNDDVFAKRTIVVPRKKVDTEEPTEDQRGSRNKFVDNDDFARPLSPLRHDKEVLDHTTTEVMKDNTTAQQKSGTEEATPKKKVIKVVKKKNITPASSEDQDSVVVNGEAKIEKNNLTLKEGGKAIANGEVVKSSADGEVDDKAPKKEAVAKKEEEVSKDGVKGSEGVEAKPDAEVDERKTGIVKKEVEDTTGGGVNIKTVPLKDEPVVSSADKKLVSKRSLVQKADKDDPDLQVFVPPEPESKPEPEQKETFVPLQSNRLTQFMQPWKKPEQFDVCPVEIWAKPKVIRGRHYPRPRGHPAVQPHSDSEEDSESEEESTSSSSEDDSTSEEEEEECDGGTTKVAGASTSSVDSGFGSGAACKKGRGANPPLQLSSFIRAWDRHWQSLSYSIHPASTRGGVRAISFSKNQ